MKKFILLIGLLTLTGSAFAGPVKINFTGFSAGGWQTGYPYYATVNGGSVIDVMCDDWYHGGLPGQTWQANYTNLGSKDLSTLRFNQMPGALTLYEEAAWLLLQTEVTPRNQWMAINFTVWNIFDPNAPTEGTYWLTLAQREAALGFPGVNFNSIAIYTPVNQYDRDPNGPQELLTIVPEPSTLLLLGSGPAGLLSRKRLL